MSGGEGSSDGRGLLTRRSLLGVGGAVTALGLLDAFGVEPYWLDVNAYDLPVPHLPRSLDGYTIAHVTDAHLSRLGRVEEGIVRAVDESDAQLVVLTGDIIDNVERLRLVSELCGALRKPGRRVLATLGNWEHWGEIPLAELARTYADAGARLLVNEAHDFDGSLHVVATDDSTAGNPKFVRHGARPAHASLFLTHSPWLLDRVPDGFGRFDLALAGHTHGGQVRLGPYVTPALPPGGGRFVAGFYNVRTGRAYVSRGTGTSLIPARFTCRPELPIFTLRQG